MVFKAPFWRQKLWKAKIYTEYAYDLCLMCDTLQLILLKDMKDMGAKIISGENSEILIFAIYLV